MQLKWDIFLVRSYTNTSGLCIVTYWRVLFTMDIYFRSKTQHITVKHSQQLFEHTYTSNILLSPTLDSNRLRPAGPLLVLFHTNWPSNQSKSVINSLVTIEPNYNLFTLFRDNALRPSSIVASLRRRNNVVLLHCYVTGHWRHVATETIARNSIFLLRFETFYHATLSDC
jgi:hypothetical protein